MLRVVSGSGSPWLEGKVGESLSVEVINHCKRGGVGVEGVGRKKVRGCVLSLNQIQIKFYWQDHFIGDTV